MDFEAYILCRNPFYFLQTPGPRDPWCELRIPAVAARDLRSRMDAAYRLNASLAMDATATPEMRREAAKQVHEERSMRLSWIRRLIRVLMTVHPIEVVQMVVTRLGRADTFALYLKRIDKVQATREQLSLAMSNRHPYLTLAIVPALVACLDSAQDVLDIVHTI